ncbi:MAG: hypothetical protein KF855_13995 [Acidobacteria bacterium]|nr:hypothetical protein [Acidobacteriota bacterium]
MVRNILAVIAGIVVGGIVNMAIVTFGPAIIPPPAGADLTTAEGLKAAMPLMETKHFIAPFAAHALGTLVGALTAALIAVGSKTTLAMIVGGFFLLGGIAACLMIPAPMWFIALDLIVAYIPMAWIGAKLGGAGKAAG